MRLSRRDAIVTAVGGGLVAGVGSIAADVAPVGRAEHRGGTTTPEREEFSNDELGTLAALAEVVYPSKVEVTEEFIRGYVEVRTATQREGVRRALSALRRRSKRWSGREFSDLTERKRDALLGEIGVDRAQPDRGGSATQRIRYYLVNGLLFALFTSPKGSELVGIENPMGYPGGYDTITEPNRDQ